MGSSVKNAAFFIFLIMSSISLGRGDEVTDRLNALEEENRSQSQRIQNLEDQNGKKEQRINVLELQNQQLLYSVNGLTHQLGEIQGNLNETKDDIIRNTNTLVETEVGTLNEKIKEFEDYTNKVNMPESCGQLKMLGVTKPKTLLVNPQKVEANNEPIEVITSLKNSKIK